MIRSSLQPAELPAPVRECAALLASAGGRCWVVGGAVRDLLRGRQPTDFDLATDLLPHRVAASLGCGELDEARFGTVRWRRDGVQLVITTLRAEAGYRDRRRPDEVQFVGEPAIDAARRDFTVNAIYCAVATGAIEDPLGGLADLAAGVLRAVGDPAARLAEDPLRLLRLVRFAAGCELTPEEATAAGARLAAPRLTELAVERCFDELTRMFVGPGRGRALRLLVELGIADVLLPEAAALDGVPQPPEHHPEGDCLVHTCLVLDHVPAGSPELSWAAVLHDVGKPPTFCDGPDRIRFHGHDTLSASMADAVLRRLHAPRSLRERVVAICRDHIRFASLPAMRPVRAERWLRDPDFPLHLAFHRADCLGSHGRLDIHDFAVRTLAALPPQRAPLVGGRDALALGVPAGVAVGVVLQATERALDDRTVPPTRAEALVLLRDVVERWRQGTLPEAR